jgi:mediator of RNA polymerase II transcription subunit 31
VRSRAIVSSPRPKLCYVSVSRHSFDAGDDSEYKLTPLPTDPTIHIMSASAAVKTDVLVKEAAKLLPENRFELELEFIQCLASPAYLHHLATTGVLADRDFLDFLEYLQYWKQPEYVKYLNYPHCLYFLDLLLNNAIFRRELGNLRFRNFVHEQQFYSWQHRARTLYGQGLPGEVPVEKEQEPPTKEDDNDEEIEEDDNDDEEEEEEEVLVPSY